MSTAGFGSLLPAAAAPAPGGPAGSHVPGRHSRPVRPQRLRPRRGGGFSGGDRQMKKESAVLILHMRSLFALFGFILFCSAPAGFCAVG